MNKKKVPEKNKTKPTGIQIDDKLYSSFLIILSYKTKSDEDRINIDSTPVGIESNSFREPVIMSNNTNAPKTILEIFMKSLNLSEINSLSRYIDKIENSTIVNSR
jgi:hypothetical protein